MSFTNLRSFIRELDKMGEVKKITIEVDPFLEIADRMSKTGGPALLFENVKGASFPLLINAFGSYRWMQSALSCTSFDDIANCLESFLKIQPPRSFMNKLRMLGTLKTVSDFIPRKVKKAPCQERVFESGQMLDMIPILTTWLHDSCLYSLVFFSCPDPEESHAASFRYPVSKGCCHRTNFSR